MANLFVDSDEREITTLGGSYLDNWLSTGSLEKGYCVVSDKRVYFRGKCYSKSGNIYKSAKEERTVDLKDITGTGFAIIKNPTLLICAILGLVWCIISVLMFQDAVKYRGSIGWCYIFFSGVLPSVILWVLYFTLKLKVFEVSFAGGIIAFKASSYNQKELQDFQKALRKAKDNCREVHSSGSSADELRKYKELLDSGVISQEEFDNIKRKILG